MAITLTAYQGRAGDRNNLGVLGARSIADEIAARLRVSIDVVGSRQPALGQRWDVELEAAMTDLRLLARHLRAVVHRGDFALTALPRCAAAIATLPVIADSYPDAVVVWLDAHGDLNTPESTTSGYLGGLAISGPVGLWNSGLGNSVRLSNVILVGSRDLDPFEANLIATGKVRHIRADSPTIAAELREFIADRRVYIHLDCDVLEPGLVPTEFEVPNGLSFSMLEAVAQVIATQNPVGLEIAEFQSHWSDGKLASPAELLTALRPLIDTRAIK